MKNLASEIKVAILKVTEQIKDWPVVFAKGKFKPVSEVIFLKLVKKN
jgi:hypothetical protein